MYVPHLRAHSPTNTHLLTQSPTQQHHKWRGSAWLLLGNAKTKQSGSAVAGNLLDLSKVVTR